MKYENNDEISKKGFLMLDGEEENIEITAQVISKHTKIPSKRIKSFIMNRGLKDLFDNPSLLGANEEQTKLLQELRELVDWGIDNNYESIQ